MTEDERAELNRWFAEQFENHSRASIEPRLEKLTSLVAEDFYSDLKKLFEEIRGMHQDYRALLAFIKQSLSELRYIESRIDGDDKTLLQ